MAKIISSYDAVKLASLAWAGALTLVVCGSGVRAVALTPAGAEALRKVASIV